jgi:Domain of unknown function (DUF4832)/Domain of unknown function (DUF4874)
MEYLPKLLAIGGSVLILLAGYQSQIIGERNLSNSAKNLQVDTKKNPLNVLTTYQPSDQNFPNPERGFTTVYDPPWPQDLKTPWGFCNLEQENAKKYTYTAWTEPLKLESLKSQRDRGISVALVRYHIADFRNKPLSPAFLSRLDRDFATVRKAGLKSAIRFVYNWPLGGPDAPIDRVLLHLDQLKPVLKRNVDAIAFMDAGFIGCWGEWHTSSNNLIGMDKNVQAIMNNNSRLIIDKIFAVLPQERMVAVRYPRYKFDYFGSKDSQPIAPLPASEAFTGSRKARWGQGDDCLVCGEWNASTYWSPRQNAKEIQTFLNQDNRYVLQSGEPGDIPAKPAETDEDRDGYKDNYDSCDRVLNIFSNMRWSTISGGFNPKSPTSAYKRWKQEGCYETIAKKLGYRFRLIESSIPTHSRPGGQLLMNFKIVNDGWAAPYNPRKLEVILRNQHNGSISRLNLREDPRFWQAGETYSVKIKQRLPRNLPVGKYDLLLNLPDPTSTLRNRPEYSIRLANKDLWESSSGYNSFARSITIELKK